MRQIKKIFLIICLLFLFPALSLSQIRNQLPASDVGDMMRSAVYNAYGKPGFLGFDLSKLKFSHSYSLAFSSFGGGNSLTRGLYLNTISYEFSIPLSLSMQWGFTHQPFQTGFNNANLGSQIFLSGAELRYQPSRNTLLKLQFYQTPRGYLRSPYQRSGYRSRFFQDNWLNDDFDW